MPRKSVPPISFSSLEWDKLPYYLNLGSEEDDEPLPLLDYEYNGEGGETEDEYITRINRWNQAQVLARKEAKAKLNEERRDFLAPFKKTAVMPQLMATIGRLPLVIESGKVQIVKTLKNWSVLAKANRFSYSNGKPLTLDELKGMIAFMTWRVRGNIVTGTQTKETAYNASVPLVLRAFKEYQNIKYSQYPLNEDLKYFVDPHNMNVMLLKEDLFSRDDLVKLHYDYLSVPYAQFSINCKKEPLFDGYDFDSHMCAALIQVWIYAPNLWHEYAIHNLKSFDSPPDPLVPQELFIEKPKMLMPNKLSQKTIYEKDETIW